ncbi:hypothetical protein PHYBOEH_001839 [Phytophthora boehmeriae]|uniref:Uncharacterized protein n=1 Tax=Phytophthora boehmeriae TaxID=109152 RepID=A0A8T1WYC7_9STRA|nr:hypothetical protein PHYBOEH_001839 [Phytophthora boehmeriae]
MELLEPPLVTLTTPFLNSPLVTKLEMGSETSASSASSDETSAPPYSPPPPTYSPYSSLSTGVPPSSSSSESTDTQGSENASNPPKLESLASSSDVSRAASSSSSSSQASVNVGDSSSSAGGSSSCSDDEESEDSVDWTASDRCPYYQPRDDGCTEPRTCWDCLNTDIGEDYSCMVNQYGRCVQKRHGVYVKGLDFQQQTPSNDCDVGDEQKVQFPSETAQYCKPYDRECKRCKRKAFADVMKGKLNGSLTKFCYGEDGCVCIAVCEAPIWKSTIGQTVCNGSIMGKKYDSEHANTNDSNLTEGDDEHGVGLVLTIVGVLAAVVILVIAADWARRRSNGNSSSGSSSAGSAQTGDDQDGSGDADGPAPVAAPNLSLFGWQAMRSELIEREQLLLAGVEDFSNVRTGYLQLLDVDASAPPQEEDESSAPVLLVPLAGASAPTFSPRDVSIFASAPSAPPVSPTFDEEYAEFEEELL